MISNRPFADDGLVISVVNKDSELGSTELILPGLIVLVLHFMAMAVTADTIVTEKETGLFDRLVARYGH